MKVKLRKARRFQASHKPLRQEVKPCRLFSGREGKWHSTAGAPRRRLSAPPAHGMLRQGQNLTPSLLLLFANSPCPGLPSLCGQRPTAHPGRARLWLVPTQRNPYSPSRRALPSLTSPLSTSAKPFCIYGAACSARAWVLFAHTSALCLSLLPGPPANPSRSSRRPGAERGPAGHLIA